MIRLDRSSLDRLKNSRLTAYKFNPDEVVQFLAPSQGLLYTANRAISTALKLQQSADRFAANEIAAGWLQQTDASEPMSAEDLSELAAAWRNARQQGAIGALNSVMTYKDIRATRTSSSW
jgi:hypothetical protein